MKLFTTDEELNTLCERWHRTRAKSKTVNEVPVDAFAHLIMDHANLLEAVQGRAVVLHADPRNEVASDAKTTTLSNQENLL